MTTPPSEPRGREHLLVAGLAVAMALRVLLFAAAFPFFTNVDEQKHVDMVLKYARGYLPRAAPGADAYEPEMGELVGIHGSPEYHLDPARGAAGDVPLPPWRHAPGEMGRRIDKARAFFASRANKEAHQPPLYYVTAGAWLRLGRGLGLEGGYLLYWVRALSALAALLLVVVSHRFLREAYPENALVRLGVPVLLVVFPMDALYYVTRDVLSPLLGALGFFLAVRLAREPTSGAGRYAAAGAVAALGLLGKYTNAVIFALLALVSAWLLRARPPAPPRRETAGRLLWLWALAVGPVAIWLVRNQLVFGDPTATALKAQRLGWSPRPFSELLSHPLFTPTGSWAFLRELVPSFWRGELVWYRELLASGAADAFYRWSSLVLLALAAGSLARGRDPRGSRPVELLALAAVATAVAVLVALSLRYVYPEVGNPSAARPWFDHGRLVAGVLVPFLILYLRGLQVATSALPQRPGSALAWLGVALVASVSLGSELTLSRPVFASAYNWYALP